jgi:cyclase
MAEIQAINSTGRRMRPRAIPVLLLRGDLLLYKTVKFKEPRYVGDPRIAVKIFNDKGADEIVLLDIEATPKRRQPNFALIEEIAGEAFMPMAYGGGIRDQEAVRTILSLGVEKVIINTHAVENPDFITEAAAVNGAQSIVVSIDAKKTLFGGWRVFTRGGREKTKFDPVALAKRAVEAGAGEILINSIDRDGTFAGYDVQLVRSVADGVDVPVIACGGAGSLEDLARAVNEGHASAVAAGSFFVFQRPHRAVLITLPDDRALYRAFGY